MRIVAVMDVGERQRRLRFDCLETVGAEGLAG
jgi:hypothetical protein